MSAHPLFTARFFIIFGYTFTVYTSLFQLLPVAPYRELSLGGIYLNDNRGVLRMRQHQREPHHTDTAEPDDQDGAVLDRTPELLHG